jgi:hypothetical protein
LNHLARRVELIVGIVPGFTIGSHSPALARLPRSAPADPAAANVAIGGPFWASSFQTRARENRWSPNNSLEPTLTARENGDSVWLRSCRRV